MAITKEIIDDKFTETDGTLKEVINQSIKEWREVGRFFRTYGEIERGLLGELWFLNYLIDVNDESMVHGWRGPENDRHDFRINNNIRNLKNNFVKCDDKNNCKYKLVLGKF